MGLAAPLPLLTLLVDGRLTPAAALPTGLSLTVTPEAGFAPGVKITVVLRNEGKTKITLENLVPLGQGADRVYITAGLPNKRPTPSTAASSSVRGSGRSASCCPTTPGTSASPASISAAAGR